MKLSRKYKPRATSPTVSTLYIIFLLLPIYWLVNMSFKTNTEITRRLLALATTRRSGTTRSSSPIRPGTTATSTRSPTWR
jgi:ABC-type glycerol-3-phosphate transport system permease component